MSCVLNKQQNVATTRVKNEKVSERAYLTAASAFMYFISYTLFIYIYIFIFASTAT